MANPKSRLKPNRESMEDHRGEGHRVKKRILLLNYRTSLTFYCPYLYNYPIGIPLYKTRLMSPLGQQRVK